MSASFPTIRILNCVCRAGKPAVDRRGRQVITARLSYDDFQRLCRLARASIAAGIRAAVADGWLFCRPGAAPDRRTTYSVPVHLNSSINEPSSPLAPNGAQSCDGSETELSKLASIPDGAFYTYRSLGPDNFILEIARSMDGLDEEIAKLRVMLRDLALNEPDRLDLYLRGVVVLATLLNTRYRTKANSRNNRLQTAARVYREIALPLGPVAVRMLRKSFPEFVPPEEKSDPAADSGETDNDEG
jgi:hypothetical protein